ncbi:MAG: phosphodiester glycosidase family protein [Planctomycetota bacterium]
MKIRSAGAIGYRDRMVNVRVVAAESSSWSWWRRGALAAAAAGDPNDPVVPRAVVLAVALAVAAAVGAQVPGGAPPPAGEQAPAAAALAPMPADCAARAAWQSDEIGVGVQLRFRWFERLYAGPQSLTVVEVEPKAEVRYDVVAPGVRTKTSAMGAQTGALAALNGGFFAIASTGLSTGLRRLDGALGGPATPAQARIGIGDDQRLRVATRPEGDGPEVHDALGAGPMLLRAGAVVDHGARQRRIRHPRSAIGVGKDGSVVWLTADGRTSKAAGLAHEETAAILQALGCVDAVNLDGGGSTTLWVAGRGVVNHPCDNKKYDHAGERAVANAVLLRAPAVVVVDDAQATLRGDGWTRATVAGGKGVVGAGYARWSAKAGTSAAVGEAPSAEFAAELPFAGTWRAMAWLPVGSEVAAGPWRVVVGADGAVREVAGQRGEWVEVARVEVGTERKVVVQLGGVAGRAVVVDAVRWVEIR